jgi:serine/threonine-protein kinase HipA
MTLPSNPQDAYVWVWLPRTTEPVVAGNLRTTGGQHQFIYGDSYLARDNKISLYTPELPLVTGWQGPLEGLTIASCLRDAGPDSWGQRVVRNRLGGEPSQIDYFLHSGSNRIGALDFQTSPETYVPRNYEASLEELLGAADDLEAGVELSAALEEALTLGSSLGGARPKVTLERANEEWIAKFSSKNDTTPVVKSEALALELARRRRLRVPDSKLVRVGDRDVLLVRRFDRPGDSTRRMVVSGLTMLGLDENFGRYATYPDLLEVLRRSSSKADVGRELFERIVFNVAIGNTDDHARNHAAFWDGTHLDLTPAYDLEPKVRSGGEATQSMAIGKTTEREDKLSSFRLCLDSARIYGLAEHEARDVIDQTIQLVEDEFDDAARSVGLTAAERDQLWESAILNPFSREGYGNRSR